VYVAETRLFVYTLYIGKLQTIYLGLMLHKRCVTTVESRQCESLLRRNTAYSKAIQQDEFTCKSDSYLSNKHTERNEQNLQ